MDSQTGNPTRFHSHVLREKIALDWVTTKLAGEDLPPDSAGMRFSLPWDGPATILCPDRKAGWALSVQIRGNCHPTPTCMAWCYATAESSMPANCHRKWAYVDLMLQRTSANQDGELERGFLSKLIEEARQAGVVRLLSHGDFSPSHLPAVRQMIRESPATRFFGFSRKPFIVQAITSWGLANVRMHLSIDKDRKAPEGFSGTTAYLRTRPDEPEGPSNVLVAFDLHVAGRLRFKSGGELRCPAYDDSHNLGGTRIPACLACGRCLPTIPSSGSSEPSSRRAI